MEELKSSQHSQRTRWRGEAPELGWVCGTHGLAVLRHFGSRGNMLSLVVGVCVCDSVCVYILSKRHFNCFRSKNKTRSPTGLLLQIMRVNTDGTFLHASHCVSVGIISLFSPPCLHERGTTLTSILQIRKLRSEKLNCLCHVSQAAEMGHGATSLLCHDLPLDFQICFVLGFEPVGRGTHSLLCL